MSGHYRYPSGPQPSYDANTYNGPAPSAPGQNYSQPWPPSKTGQQLVQNGSFGGPNVSQFPTHGGPVTPHTVGGAPPTVFHSQFGADVYHHQIPSATLPPTTQFQNMALTDPTKPIVRPGVVHGSMPGPPRPGVPLPRSGMPPPPVAGMPYSTARILPPKSGMPPASGEIPGPPSLRGTAPPPVSVIGASPNTIPSTGLVTGSSIKHLPTNMAYPSSQITGSLPLSTGGDHVSTADIGEPPNITPPPSKLVPESYAESLPTHIGYPSGQIIEPSLRGTAPAAASSIGVSHGSTVPPAGSYTEPVPTNVGYHGGQVAGPHPLTGTVPLPSGHSGHYTEPTSTEMGYSSSGVGQSPSFGPGNVHPPVSGSLFHTAAGHALHSSHGGPLQATSFGGPSQSAIDRGPPQPALMGGTSHSALIRGPQPASIGGPPQLALVGRPQQPASIGGPQQPESIGGPQQPASIGGHQQPASIGGPQQPAFVGRPPQPVSFGRPPQPVSFGRPPQPTLVGRPQQPVSVGGPSQATPLGRPPQASLSGRPPHPTFVGRPPPPPTSVGGPQQPYSQESTAPPPSIGHQQYSHEPGVGQYQDGYHREQVPPSPSHPQQFHPPPAGPPYSSASYSAQAVHSQRPEGPPLPTPEQRQMPGTAGQFPGSAPYTQQPIGYPSQQPQPAPQSPKQLDPDQLPSPIQVIEDDKKNRSGVYQTSTRGSVPPLVTTKFITQDLGNASPRFIRSTMYNIPCTSDMLKSAHIPFGLVLTPFAELADQEEPPPLVDPGELGPVRCKRCKAYMSPFMLFIDAGRRFQCAFCGAITDVPNEYFAHLDHTGRRVDSFSRPELSFGSYEFVAGKDYCKNGIPPKEPAFIFMIDVSYNSIKSGLVQLICDKLKSDIFVNLPKESGAEESEIRVGFVTYHRELHFYNVKNLLAQPHMMVVSDLEDVFVPMIDGFLVKLSEAEVVIDSLLAQIPELFSDSKETELILGPVIQAGLDALKSADRAGRLYIFHTGLPTLEAPGKLKNRDDRKLLGTDKEKTILTPQTNFYSKLGAECVAAGCSVDLFLFPNQYVDLATISDICKITAGNIFKYSYFQADLDGERFLADLKTTLKQSQAFDAIVRVRTSAGIRPVEFFGNFYMANTTDIEMASIDSDATVCVEVKHDDRLSETEGACVQVAVLYTSVTGQRRLRCHNLSFKCCNQLTDLFRYCELDVLINFFAKQGIRMCLSTNPRHVKEHITNETAQILACYRKNCANPSSPGQLVLPECMKLLPLYANCVTKSDCLSGGSEISADDRSYLMFLVNRMDVKSTHVFFYPRLIPFHTLDFESSEFPVAIRCSADRLEDTGIYILENGLCMFLWLGHNASSDLLQKIFGLSSAAQIDIDKVNILRLDNPVSRRLCDLIANIRQERSRYLKLTIVRQRDKLESWFGHFLVEDKGLNSGSSYVDFLLHIHKEIRTILS